MAMTPKMLAHRIRQSARAAHTRVKAEERRVAQAALRKAKGLSSGLFSTAELRRGKWHPYAKRRHAVPQLPAAIINVQTGLFRASWELKVDTDGEFVIENNTPYADYLQAGTDKMFRRPIDDVVEQWWERERYNRITATLHKVGL